MKTGAKGIELIKRWEGLELTAYQDIAGVWTIGYGHTASATSGLVWTEQVAEAALTRDLESREDAVARLVTAPLTQNRFDALVSLIYNIGVTAFQNSTVRKRINNGDSDFAVAEAWGWFNKATVNGELQRVEGLARRRAAEIALWMTPEDRATFDDAPDTGAVAAPGKSAGVSPPPPSIVPPESAKRDNLWTRLRRFLAHKTQRRFARRDDAPAALAGIRHPEAP